MDSEKIKKKVNSIINSSNAKSFLIILIMILIAIGYIFFFNSTKFFGENYDYEITEIGQVMSLENNHTVKLTRSDIDIENNCIEYEFYFQNSNYDGCDDYNIDIRSSNKSGKISSLEVTTICSDSDVYVVRAALPKSWTAIVADITVKNSQDITLETKFYSNIDSLYQTTISGNTREHFLKLDTNRNIERLGNEIINLKETNINLEKKISEIDNRIKTLQERMPYMTADELKETEININSMTSEKENTIRQIDDNKKLISEYTNNITNLQSEINV